MALRWGIVGVGQISHDFCTALTASGFTDGDNDSTNKHKIVAVGSRTIERSKEFAERHNIQYYYGNYEDVAKNNDVEIVYVANLNNMHYSTCLKIIQLGKHILCEKPFAMNYHESNQIINAAKEKNLFIMEGVWSRFFPVYQYLRNFIKSHDEELIVKEVFIKHGFKGDSVDRVAKKEMGGGISLDIGVYAIQFVLMVFNEALLNSVTVKKYKVNEHGVDMFFDADLKFSGNKMGHIICSGLEELKNKATIVTNKGVITIPTYWCPTEITTFDNVTKKFPLPELSEGSSVHFINSLGLRYEADEVQKCIRSGKLFCDLISPKETLAIAHIQDEIRRQIK